MDVQNDFLNCDLKETVYMQPPPGYQLAEKTLVCRLRKSLYGLKQVHGLINFEPQFLVQDSARVRTTIPLPECSWPDCPTVIC